MPTPKIKEEAVCIVCGKIFGKIAKKQTICKYCKDRARHKYGEEKLFCRVCLSDNLEPTVIMPNKWNKENKTVMSVRCLNCNRGMKVNQLLTENQKLKIEQTK